MTNGVSDSSAATTALSDLVAQLQSAADTGDPKERIDAIGQIQDAGAGHFAVLLAHYLDTTTGTLAAREALWKSLANYQTRLTQVMCTVAAGTLTAASASRALRAIRALVKLHLIHYACIQDKLWHIAYTVHASAEKNGFATASVQAHAGDHAMTSVEQELLRLLMLRVSAPDMLTPEQVEVADCNQEDVWNRQRPPDRHIDVSLALQRPVPGGVRMGLTHPGLHSDGFDGLHGDIPLAAGIH